ncbi:MAG: DUF58 domain-containing protein [Vicinamibacterales bacterium]
MATSDVAFDQDFLRKLEYLHILSKQVFPGQFHAERTARRRGAGIEFADHRGYTPGDDFRHVDWKAYQRLGKLLLRLFEEEQGLPIYIFVDRSRSMAAGSPSKLQYARQVAAALCYIALAHLDRVSVIGFADTLGPELPQQRGKGQIFSIFSFLSDLTPGGGTDGANAMRQFRLRRPSRGVAVIISDFLDPKGYEPALDALRFGQHDVFAVHVTSESDIHPPLRGDVRLVDAETGEVRDLAVTPGLLAAYAAAFERYSGEIGAYCDRRQLGYLRTSTDEPFEDAVLKVFRLGRFLA